MGTKVRGAGLACDGLWVERKFSKKFSQVARGSWRDSWMRTRPAMRRSRMSWAPERNIGSNEEFF
jgi:hypothetical protein